MHIITIEKFVKRVVTAGPDEPLAGLARRMDEHNVGAVVIVAGHCPVGLVTDRDLALHLGARGTPAHARADQVMSRPVQTVRRDDGAFDTTRQMREAGVRHLPVVDGQGCVVGLVTLDDLLALLVRELANRTAGIAPEMEVKGLGPAAPGGAEDWRFTPPEEPFAYAPDA